MESFRFSFYAYFNTACVVILATIDRLIIGFLLSISKLPSYQAGAKVGENFFTFTKQFAEVLSPASAHLHAKGDHEGLRELLLNGLRYTAIISTPFYLLLAFFMPEVLEILTGIHQPDQMMVLTAQILLLWNYSTLMTHRVFTMIYFMRGHEKSLAWTNIIQTIVTVILTFAMTYYYRDILSVALGLLIPGIFVGWFYLWPWAAKESSASYWGLVRQIIVPVWISCLPMILCAGIIKMGLLYSPKEHLILALLEMFFIIVIGFIGIWFWALTSSERLKLKNKCFGT